MIKYTPQEKNKIGYGAFKILMACIKDGLYTGHGNEPTLVLSLKLLSRVLAIESGELNETRLHQELELLLIDEELGS